MWIGSGIKQAETEAEEQNKKQEAEKETEAPGAGPEQPEEGAAGDKVVYFYAMEAIRTYLQIL